MKIKPSIALCFCHLVLVGTANAVVLLHETFENVNQESYTTGTSLGGQSTHTGTGLSGTWSVANSAVQVNTNGSLSYQVAGGGGISDGGVYQQKLTASGSRRFGASLDPSVVIGMTGESSLYMRILVQVDTAFSNPNSFFWYPFSTSATAADFNNYVKFAGANNTSGQDASEATMGGIKISDINVRLPVTGSHLLVAKVDFNGTGATADKISLWIDPTPDSEATPHLSSTGTTSLTINNLQFLVLQNERVILDNVMYATAWSDVVPVPEPEILSWGVGALVVALIGFRRRR